MSGDAAGEITVGAPRDVIYRATQLWVPVTADNFPASSTIAGTTLTTPYGSWSIDVSASASVSIGPQGGLVLGMSGGGEAANISNAAKTVDSETQAWRATVNTSQSVLPSTANGSLFLSVIEDVDTYTLSIYQGHGLVQLNGAVIGNSLVLSATSYGLMIESDGEWVSAFVNGALIGNFRRAHAYTASLAAHLGLEGSGAPSMTATVTSFALEALQPFLLPA